MSEYGLKNLAARRAEVLLAELIVPCGTVARWAEPTSSGRRRRLAFGPPRLSGPTRRAGWLRSGARSPGLWGRGCSDLCTRLRRLLRQFLVARARTPLTRQTGLGIERRPREHLVHRHRVATVFAEPSGSRRKRPTEGCGAALGRFDHDGAARAEQCAPDNLGRPLLEFRLGNRRAA